MYMLSAISRGPRPSLKWKCVRRACLIVGAQDSLSLQKGRRGINKQEVGSPSNHTHRMRAARIPFFPNGYYTGYMLVT